MTDRITWSPDGKQLAFGSDREGQWSIFVVNADGSGLRKLETGGEAHEPTWSPDGRTIAFGSPRYSDQVDILALDLASGSIKRLTDNLAFDGEPSWSPDGKKIAFVSRRDREQEVFVMNADGSGAENLSRKYGLPGARPTWSPDGKRIAIDSWANPGEGKR